MSNLRLSDPRFGDHFESAMRRFFSPSAFEVDTTLMRMPMDVVERDGLYEVKADLPGFKKEEINVRIDGNLVQIDAQTSQTKEEKTNGDAVLRSERYSGAVSRCFSLAQDIDEGKVKAKFLDGVLTLELPKKASVATHKISVQ
jgi:HSP20 family protein